MNALLNHYVERVTKVTGLTVESEEEEVQDLITDLLHMAVAMNADPKDIIRRAINNFQNEADFIAESDEVK